MLQTSVSSKCVDCLSIIIFAVFLAAFAAPARAEVHRVVSLNPCLDTILVNVADREQIAALSHFARDPYSSSIADIAATFPVVNESAEEVIMLRPGPGAGGHPQLTSHPQGFGEAWCPRSGFRCTGNCRR